MERTWRKSGAGPEQSSAPSISASRAASAGRQRVPSLSVCHCPSDTAGINHARAAETAGNAPPPTPTLPRIPVMPAGWQGAKPDVTSWHRTKTLFKETLTSPGTPSAAGDLQPRVCGKSNDVLWEGRAGTQTSITSLLAVQEGERAARSLPSISPRSLNPGVSSYSSISGH